MQSRPGFPGRRLDSIGRPGYQPAWASCGSGAGWRCLLLQHQDALLLPDLVRYATDAGLDPGPFRDYLTRRSGAARVAEDVDSADLSGVSGTPSFFINGRRHYGSYDIDALTAAVRTAKAAGAIRAGDATRAGGEA